MKNVLRIDNIKSTVGYSNTVTRFTMFWNRLKKTTYFLFIVHVLVLFYDKLSIKFMILSIIIF